MRKELFTIRGMTCAACAQRVHKAAAALDGVNEVAVNLLRNSMSVGFDEAVVSAEGIISAVERSGYGANFRDDKVPEVGGSAAAELPAMKRRLGISLLFTLPLFYLSMGGMVGLPLPHFVSGPANALNYALTQFLLAVPMLAVNFRYFYAGFKSLCAGAPNMDSLIAGGSGAAVVFGIYTLWAASFSLGHGDATTHASA